MPPDTLLRERLHARLDEATTYPVTLVAGPAGAGKTVLLASWATGRKSPVAWVSLDRELAGPERFWAELDRAVESAGVRAPKAGGAGAQRLRARLSGPEPIVVVVDDVQELRSRVVLRQLDALLVRPPPGLRLVLSTRRDPLLELGELRRAGALAEIRAEELAFTDAEARHLLGPPAEGLTPDELRLVCHRLEGWAAGLRLARLSLASSGAADGFVDRMARMDRSISEYLFEEVFAGLDERLREFLLATSVPDTLDVRLAAHVTGRRDAARVLARLAHDGLFVVEHGPETYRLQPLFRAFLQAELRRRPAEQAMAIHAAAARWYAREESDLLAVRHALEAGDWACADMVLGWAWPMIVMAAHTGDIGALWRRMPFDVADVHPAVQLVFGLSHMTWGNAAETERRLVRARGLIDDAPEHDAGMHALLVLAEAAQARFAGDGERLLAAGRELLALQEAGTFAPGRRDRAFRAVALTFLGIGEHLIGRLDDAERHFEELLGLTDDLPVQRTVVNALAGLAEVALARGELERAAVLARRALAYADEHDLAETRPAAGAHFTLGVVEAYRDDQARATECLARVEQIVHVTEDASGRALAALLAAVVRGTDSGRDADEARRRLRGIAGDGVTLPPFHVELLPLLEGRALAALGDHHAARDRVLRAPPGSPARVLVRARLALGDGDPAGALGALAEADGQAWHPAFRIEAHVLEALARAQAHEDATAPLEDALALAEADDYVRPFAEAGPAFRALLADHVRAGDRRGGFAVELLAVLDRRPSLVETTAAELLEPLSERESTVLRYLPTMMSNPEIARELYVSTNTVKTHLRSIFRKLGVTRRRDAVERARELRLL